MLLERQNCEWALSQSMLDVINELRSELDELEVEISNRNDHKLQEEVADVFSDVMLLLHVGERDGLVSSRQDIVDRAFAKKMRRKGWVMEGKKVSREEASRIWHEAKKREKNASHP